MAEYWCRFIDQNGRVCASEKLIARDDREAVAAAHRIVRREGRQSFELWDGHRRVEIDWAAFDQSA